MLIRKVFYALKPVIPRKLQLFLRRIVVKRQLPLYADVWPIDRKANKIPEKWPGWPENKQFALILTHDVDTNMGQKRCYDIVKLEEELGFKSCFNFVPERYPVSPQLRQYIIDRGFEVGVHGLLHDGKLFKSKNIFQKRAVQINQYLKAWNSKGFRSPAMHYNLDWIVDLDIEYDMSTFDTDPFEPQPDGAGTIFPFIVKGSAAPKVIVEMPYTLPQDFTIFVLLKESNIDIWKKKLDWIVENGGMALLNTHPDYMNFTPKKESFEEYSYKLYECFLKYVYDKYKGKFWHVLPEEIARYTISVMK